MLAVPNYPYNARNVYNRNQLGGLGDLGLGTWGYLALIGVGYYLLMGAMRYRRK